MAAPAAVAVVGGESNGNVQQHFLCMVDVEDLDRLTMVLFSLITETQLTKVTGVVRYLIVNYILAEVELRHSDHVMCRAIATAAARLRSKYGH